MSPTASKPRIMTKGDQDRAFAIGRRLKDCRDVFGWTQDELAVEAGVARSTIAEIEAGRVPDPLPRTVKKLASALKVEPRWIRHGEE
jgi:transcriptional regulator with XRE-family HTH domain